MMPNLSIEELLDLKNAILNDFDSSNWRELGALTNKLDEVENHSRLLRSLRFGDEDYGGLIVIFLRKLIGPNEENLAVVQKYVTETCSSFGQDISSERKIGPKVIFSPSVFQIPNEPCDPKLISVMMPFSHEFLPTYEAIKNAANSSDFECYRADDIWNDSVIVQDIFSLIFRSFIVVCDFTGKNPNVFYEAGIAHTLGKHVVPITQSMQDIPFDLRQHRCARYLDNEEGRSNLERDLRSRFSSLNKNRNS